MASQEQRPRFYEGQYLGADDLAAVVDHGRVQDAQHALGAHTWGIGVGLTLVERPAPGHAQRREVFLQPGHAWDGFGRPLVVLAPTRLAESDFASIPFDPLLDDEASGGKGRAVEVWLTYDELRSSSALPGFESCDADDQRSRVNETFRVVIGPQTGVDLRAPVEVAGRLVDALQALQTSGSPSPQLLFDTSVAFQRLPALEPPFRRWLIPIGYVRWLVQSNGRGFFVDKNWDTSRNLDDLTRRFRRYIGVVSEEIVAPDGALVLRKRSSDPEAAHRFRARLRAEAPGAVLDDLVWVEGNLRVEGNLKLAAGRADFRNADGLDDGTPLYLERFRYTPAVGTPYSELRAILGPSTGQLENRFSVGVAPANASDVAWPILVVQSNRRVGVGTRSPVAPLEVVGNWSNGEGALRLTGDKPALRLTEQGSLGHSWSLGVGQEKPGTAQLSHLEPDATWKARLALTATGDVGIGTAEPAAKLDVRDVKITAGGSPLGQDKWLQIGTDRADGDDGKLWLQYGPLAAPLLVLSDKDDPPRIQFQQSDTGTESNPQWRSFIGHATSNSSDIAISGPTPPRVGIGTEAPAPETRLHVRGPRIRLESDDAKRLDLRADGSALDLHALTHDLFLQSSGPGGQNRVVVNPHPENGNVGVGTAAPQAKLHVVDTKDGDAGQLSAHVALIDNASTGSSADVLALRVATPRAGPSNNFITFFNGTTAIGRIEGGGAASSIALVSGGADFAESLEVREPLRALEPGDVVGVLGGRLSLETRDADHVTAVTDNPVVVGAAHPRAGRSSALAALIGQVAVKVRGPVRSGDLLVASGLSDGTAVAFGSTSSELAALEQIVGVAWESSDGPQLRRVNVAVGVASVALARKLGRAVADQEESMRKLRERFDALERELRQSKPAGARSARARRSQSERRR